MVTLKICRNCVAVRLQSESFFDDGNEHIDRDGNPYLGFDGILRGAVEDLISQTFSIGGLRECPAQVLVETGKTYDLAVAAIALYATPKGVHGQMIDDLRENEFAYIHGPCPPAIPQEHGELGFSISSR